MARNVEAFFNIGRATGPGAAVGGLIKNLLATDRELDLAKGKQEIETLAGQQEAANLPPQSLGEEPEVFEKDGRKFVKEPIVSKGRITGFKFRPLSDTSILQEFFSQGLGGRRVGGSDDSNLDITNLGSRLKGLGIKSSDFRTLKLDFPNLSDQELLDQIEQGL